MESEWSLSGLLELLGVQVDYWDSTGTPSPIQVDSTETPSSIQVDSTQTQDLAFKLVSENIKGLYVQDLNPQPLVSGLYNQISRCSSHLSQLPDMF